MNLPGQQGVADPEVMVLVEPTSAVDAHTEARVAQRLRVARAGRTTLVTTASRIDDFLRAQYPHVD